MTNVKLVVEKKCNGCGLKRPVEEFKKYTPLEEGWDITDTDCCFMCRLNIDLHRRTYPNIKEEV